MILLILFFLLIPAIGNAAPTFDVVTSTTADGVSSFTINHTVTGGCNNNILVIGIANLNGNNNPLVTSITVDGVNATSIGSVTLCSSSACEIDLVYQTGVATGSARAVTFNFSDAANAVTADVRSYCSVNQATPVGTAATNSGSGTALSDTVTSASGDLVVDTAVSTDLTSLTVGGGQTQRTHITDTASSYLFYGTSDKTGAASVSMTWTSGLSGSWAQIGVSLKALTATVAKRRIVNSQ